MRRLTELIKKYEQRVEYLAENWEVTIRHMECVEIREHREECQAIEDVYNALKELQHYKDLEEQGRLITLPCLPDEIVYAAHEDCRTVKVAYASIEHILADLEAGWCIGYTQEEAEAKLEELKEGVE